MTFKIDKGVPNPVGGLYQYYLSIGFPFGEMAVGDSFAIDLLNDPKAEKGDRQEYELSMIEAVIKVWCESHPEQDFFLDKTGPKQARIWRTK